MLFPSVPTVLASLALFGVAAATESWKFVAAPVAGEAPVEFNRAWIIFTHPSGSSKVDNATLKLQKDGSFALLEDLESEERTVKTLVLAASGKRLFLKRSRLNPDSVPEEAGQKVVTIEYNGNEVEEIHELCSGGFAPRRLDPACPFD